MKGYLEQKGTPTPDKPVEIKSKLIGKNLFETYEVNSRTYTGNLPKNAFISIPKKQYIEYEQQKEEIERLNNIINKIEEHFVFLKMNSTGGNKEFFEDILDFIKALQELKGSDKK